MTKHGDYTDLPILAELYDLVPGYINRTDREFYLNLCKEVDGKILELGCGTGRILIPIAEAGKEITGLDLSEHMLSVCQKKLSLLDRDIQEKVNLIQGNMTNFSIDDQFNLVTIPFRAFQHLITVDDQLSCFKSIHHHLMANGLLIFDLFQVDLNIIKNRILNEEIEDFPEYELNDGRRLRRTHRVTAFNTEDQFNDVELIYYLTAKNGITERIIHAFPMRYFFRAEIEHLLDQCGFQIIHIYGDFDKSSLTENSLEMFFIAQKI